MFLVLAGLDGKVRVLLNEASAKAPGFLDEFFLTDSTTLFANRQACPPSWKQLWMNSPRT